MEGAFKSCCRGQAGCCCGRRPARLCCEFLPAIPESLSTSLMYTLFLFLGFVLMNLMLVQSIQQSILNMFPGFNETCALSEVAGSVCAHVLGIIMIYRICLSLSLFHFILAILTIMVANSSSWRGSIHNGMWGLKIFAICLIFFATFLIPVQDGGNGGNILVVVLVGYLASLLFIIIKMALIVAMIREWCYKWLKTLSVAANKCVSLVMDLTSIGIFIAAGFGFKFEYENYNSHEWCSNNQPTVIANGVFCLLLVLVATSKRTAKKVEEHPSVVFFQTALLSAYVCYMTWSIIASEYMYKANDDESEEKIVEEYCGPSISTAVSNNDIICYIGIFMAFVAVITKAFSASNSAYKIGIKLPSSDCMDCCGNLEGSGVDEHGGQKVIRNEKDGVVYNYCFFHVLFCFATMFIMMQLLNWQLFYDREKRITEVYRVSMSFVIKSISIYAVIVIYFSSLWCTGKCAGFLNRSRQVVERDGRLELEGV